MKYTSSEEANRKVQEDTEVIKKIILEKYDPISIIMFGGFGHGGGSFKKEGKKIIPLNDYDLYIIANKKIDDAELERAGEECSKALGRGGVEIVENFDREYDVNEFFHVDLHCLERKRLKKMYPTQRTADLKTSMVVYGEDVLKEISDVKIPVSDALRLLFNKLNHFAIAEGNSDDIKSIYAVKGLTDLCSALLIWKGKYVSRYQDRQKIFDEMDFPDELKKIVNKATDAKLKNGYAVKDLDKFFEQSKKWVEWSLKLILKDYLNIDSDSWKVICKKMYKKLPYLYFNDYLGSKLLFFAQYYLNLRFFLTGFRKKENLFKNLLRWRDAGLILAISLILYSYKEEEESEKYLKKLTNRTKPLKERLLRLYSIYYLQKLL
jgi:hypothetical protein